MNQSVNRYFKAASNFFPSLEVELDVKTEETGKLAWSQGQDRLGFLSTPPILEEGPEMCPWGGPSHVVGQSTLTSLLGYTDMRPVTTPRFCTSTAPAGTVQMLMLQVERLSALLSDPAIHAGGIVNRSAPSQRTFF